VIDWSEISTGDHTGVQAPGVYTPLAHRRAGMDWGTWQGLVGGPLPVRPRANSRLPPSRFEEVSSPYPDLFPLKGMSL
jgi:hypothetical protein